MNPQINNTTKIMKKNMVLFLIVLIMMPLSTMAQDIFAKYDGNNDVTYVNIKPKMFQILAKMDLNTEDPNAQEYMEMVKSITSLKALVTGEKAISTDIASWVDSRSKDLDELMEVRDDGTLIKFFVREGKKEDHVEELLIFVNEIGNKMKDSNTQANERSRQIETVVVSLTGDIDIKKINFDMIGEQAQLNQNSSNLISKEGTIFQGLKVYPNPSQDMVTIDLPTSMKNDFQVTVSNAEGRQIMTQTINSSNNTLDVSSWQTGVYLIQINYEDSRMVKRFVKQ